MVYRCIDGVWSNAFFLFPARTNIRLFAIRFQGSKFFNSLNLNIQSATTISLFKSRLKAYLLSLECPHAKLLFVSSCCFLCCTFVYLLFILKNFTLIMPYIHWIFLVLS